MFNSELNTELEERDGINQEPQKHICDLCDYRARSKRSVKEHKQSFHEIVPNVILQVGIGHQYPDMFKVFTWEEHFSVNIVILKPNKMGK